MRGAALGDRPRARAAPRRVAAVALALAAAIVLLATAPRTRGFDLSTYRTAGELARAGDPAAAFDREALQRRFAAEHGGGRAIGGFLYSPLWLAPARALAGLPEGDAATVNRTLSVFALAAGLGFVLARIDSLALQGLVAAAFVVCHPVAAILGFQNWTSWLLLALAIAAGAGGGARRVAGALAWGAAIHLKLVFAAALAALALAGERRRVALAALATAILALAVLPWTGVASFLSWGRALGAAARLGVLPLYNAISLPAAVARFVVAPRAWLASPAGVDHPAVFVAALVAWLLAGLAVARTRRDPERCLAAALVGLLLAAPLVWDHLAVVLFLVLPVLDRPRAATLALLLAASHALTAWEPRAVLAAAAGAGAPIATALGLAAFSIVATALLVDLALAPARRPAPIAAADA